LFAGIVYPLSSPGNDLAEYLLHPGLCIVAAQHSLPTAFGDLSRFVLVFQVVPALFHEVLVGSPIDDLLTVNEAVLKPFVVLLYQEAACADADNKPEVMCRDLPGAIRQNCPMLTFARENQSKCSSHCTCGKHQPSGQSQLVSPQMVSRVRPKLSRNVAAMAIR